ncbi:hypothetical protein N0V85_009490, partial [Neurospora sp. IMI 360204]
MFCDGSCSNPGYPTSLYGSEGGYAIVFQHPYGITEEYRSWTLTKASGPMRNFDPERQLFVSGLDIDDFVILPWHSRRVFGSEFAEAAAVAQCLSEAEKLRGNYAPYSPTIRIFTDSQSA